MMSLNLINSIFQTHSYYSYSYPLLLLLLLLSFLLLLLLLFILLVILKSSIRKNETLRGNLSYNKFVFWFGLI